MQKKNQYQSKIKIILVLTSLINLTTQWSEPFHSHGCHINNHHQEEQCQIILKRGETGDQGPPGCPGPRGIEGDKGDNGEKGDKGDNGGKGDSGDKGNKGLKGDDGKQIKGIDGQDGTNGQDADDLFCTCPDEAFNYLCCVLDNKNDPFNSCKDEQDLVKDCESRCLQLVLDGGECNEVLTNCENKCSNNLYHCSDNNPNIPDSTLCKTACPVVRDNCLTKKGCLNEQEKNCKDKCIRDSANNTSAKIIQCQEICETDSQKAIFLTTCEKSFLNENDQVCKITKV